MMIDKKDFPIRIAVTGATGRMGQEIIRLITKIEKKQEYVKKIVLTAIVTRIDVNINRMDNVKNIIENSVTKVIITENLHVIKDNFDILIDFTAPDISIEYLKFCVNNNKNMVIGTTGLNNNHYSVIKNASRKIGIVYSSNFSIGVNVVLKLLNTVIKTMDSISDINIVETHHNKKVDIPSGTALMMKNVIINALSTCIDDVSSYDNNFINNKICHTLSSSHHKIPIHSIRAGDSVGEHSILFSNTGENIQITHKACDRVIFANGALRAAMWLDSKIGLFNMHDVLSM